MWVPTHPEVEWPSPPPPPLEDHWGFLFLLVGIGVILVVALLVAWKLGKL